MQGERKEKHHYGAWFGFSQLTLEFISPTAYYSLIVINCQHRGELGRWQAEVRRMKRGQEEQRKERERKHKGEGRRVREM